MRLSSKIVRADTSTNKLLSCKNIIIKIGLKESSGQITKETALSFKYIDSNMCVPRLKPHNIGSRQ